MKNYFNNTKCISFNRMQSKKDNLENATIYTTIYPIKYLTEFMYKDYGTIESIYPSGADVYNYELTDKQIKKYAKSDLFIYNGLSNEKQ